MSPHTIPNFEHVVLTRVWFRIAANGRDTGATPDPKWFEGRLKLFKNYCVNSLAAQSNTNFRWFIYCENIMPEPFLEQLRELVRPYPHFEIRTIDAFTSEKIVADIRQSLKPSTDWLLTTRLDSDDGCHRDFVKRLHQSIDRSERGFYNFPNGIIAYDNKTYLYNHLSNAFISLLEPLERATTAFCGPHETLGKVAPIRQMLPFPSFVQVVHGANLSNKPRGLRVPKILALQGLEAITALTAPPLEERNAAIIIDNLTVGAAWWLRDALIGLAKPIYYKIRGK